MRLFLKLLVVLFMLVFAQAVSAANSKVQICHIPPDNPGNFHTITISEKALGAHLGHGDLSGSCSGLSEILCDDEDACTIDRFEEGTETCMNEHPPVSCDDGLLCTTDSCDSTNGCQYAPIVCDDEDLCTVDICDPNDGQCTGTPIDCGVLGICLTDTGLCNFPCDGITCDPIDQCHEPGECVLPGECDEGVPVADFTECDDGDTGTTDDQCVGGICEGIAAATCPCFTYENVMYALNRLSSGDGRNECNKGGEQGEAVNTRRITWFDNSDPSLNSGLGESLQAAILINIFNCFFTDFEDGTDTGIVTGTYEEILECTSIIDQAYADYAASVPADDPVLVFCQSRGF